MQNSYGTVDNSLEGSKAADSKDGKNSAALTAGIIIADVVGAGVLAMGDAVAKLGWLLGFVSILVLLAMNVHITMLLWRVHLIYPEAHSYLELASETFARAPLKLRSFVEGGVALLQNVYIFLVLGLYTLSIGQGLGMFFYTRQICLPTMTLVGCAILIPINVCCTRLGSYSWLIWVNIICTVGTVIIPILWMVSEGPESTRPPDSSFSAVAEDLSFPHAASAVSTFSFAFTGQLIMVNIIAEMKDSAEFPKSYIYMSVPFQALAFLGVGLAVYYYRGDAAAGMIVYELPFGTLQSMAAACLITHMVVTFVIKSVVLCQGILASCQRGGLIADARDAVLPWHLVVILVVLSSGLVAQIVPFFEDLVDLLGASFVPLTCFVVPILLYARCIWDHGPEKLGVSQVEMVVLALELIFSVVLMLYGTVTTMVHINEQWHSYGHPFECHCENLWNTCECSASRMPSCPATNLVQVNASMPAHTLGW